MGLECVCLVDCRDHKLEQQTYQKKNICKIITKISYEIKKHTYPLPWEHSTEGNTNVKRVKVNFCLATNEIFRVKHLRNMYVFLYTCLCM